MHYRSILNTSGLTTPQPSLQRLPQQRHGLTLRPFASAATQTKPLGQAVNKDIAARKKEIDEADVAPYPQYARSGDSISQHSFIEKFKYLKRGQSQEFNQSTRNGGLVVEGAIVQRSFQTTN
jgi:hypothetical protein